MFWEEPLYRGDPIGFVSMSDQFFEHPILNSPYDYPGKHWELDETRQPTGQLISTRRPTDFITPIPKPRKRRQSQDAVQQDFAYQPWACDTIVPCG
jgi:hypothetical protein